MGRIGVKTDITGNKYGKLTVIKIDHKERQYFYECLCDCGKVKIVGGAQLKNGTTKSCGCLTRLHGGYNSKLNGIWNSMKQRCLNSNVLAYKNYGGIGITVCQAWIESFEEFRKWSLDNGYKDSVVQLDRKDNHGNYEPENCRWVTRVVNCNNTRTNVVMEYNGKPTTLALITRELGLRHKYKSIWKRVKKGHKVEDSLY